MIALIVATQVARVVVYPDRAEVTRAQDVSCRGTPAKVEFNALPPSADASSLRAATSQGAVEALDLREEPRDAAFGRDATDVQKQIRAQELELAKLEDVRLRSAELVRVADGLEGTASQLIGGELVQPAPDVKSWKAAFGQTLQARLDALKQRLDAEAKERDVRRKLDELHRKEEKLGEARARRDRRVEVLVACAEGRTARVELTYMTGGASWQPAYEARADELDGKVALSLFGTITQTTGEAWEKAEIALSTALPSQDATPPEISPLTVHAQKREPPKKVLVRRDEVQHHAEAGGEEMNDSKGLAVVNEGLSVQLAVKGANDVPGDGSPARVFVATAQMPATFAWRGVPRQLPAIFRVADVVNGAPFPLLAGPVDLFRNGYVGRLPLERVAQGAKFHLTFGLEERVRVKRFTLDEVKRDTGLFKNNQRFRYAYRVEVTNLLGRAEQVELAEALPLSELSDVEVSLEDGTTKGYEKNSEDAIFTWKLQLKAGEKREVIIAFHVDVPKDYSTGY